LGDAVIVFDKNFKIRFTNPSACKLFGWPSPPLELNAVEQLNNNELIKLIENSFNNPITETIEIQHQPPGSLDTLPRVLEVELAPLTLNDNKSVNRARLVLRDVTDARNLELVRKDFVANASHELRTPLTIINGYLENLIEDEIEDKENSLNFLTVMQKHGHRLARIIEDMLTISKLESHSDTIQILPFNFKSCTEEVIARLKPLIDQKEAELKLLFPEDSTVNGDVFYWGQILFNLVENALKENEEKGIEISISLTEKDDNFIISVSDNGVGIPASSIEFIFKRFYRVDQSRGAEKKGTGLGLSIVKRAIEAHSGEITVTSTPGIITTFQVILPKNPKMDY
jgi:PAS domain S-box-containing protein